MRIRRPLIVLCLIVPALAAVKIAMADSERSSTSAAAAATAAFHDLDVAKAAGYAEFHDANDIACIAHPSEGAMGVHFVNGRLVGDTVVDPERPAALVYGPRADGTLKLVALEYIVFQAAWDAEHSSPPELFGQPFDLVQKPNRYGLEAFYALHAWIWTPNPSGLLFAWNPRVTCP
jgi:hypothetical protein